MNDIDPKLVKQMENIPVTHALSIGMGVKMVGDKQVVVTIFDGALFKEDTLKDLAMNAFRAWLSFSDEAENWEPSAVWRDIKDGEKFRATRYVTLRKMR